MSTNAPVLPVYTEECVLTILTDMFVTAKLDIKEHTVKMVSATCTSVSMYL